MNRIKAISLVARATGKDLKTTSDIINTFLETVKSTLVKGEKVVIDNFGAFRIVECKERKCRNPKTGEEIIVPSHQKPHFTAARNFREFVNNPE